MKSRALQSLLCIDVLLFVVSFGLGIAGLITYVAAGWLWLVITVLLVIRLVKRQVTLRASRLILLLYLIATAFVFYLIFIKGSVFAPFVI